jgi:hypothetical protein
MLGDGYCHGSVGEVELAASSPRIRGRIQTNIPSARCPLLDHSASSAGQSSVPRPGSVSGTSAGGALWGRFQFPAAAYRPL